MKLKALTFAGTALAVALLASCSGEQKQSSSSSQISNFEIDETIKTATQSYQAAAQADTLDPWSSRITLSTSIQWPMKFGDANIKALQDTIVSRAFSIKGKSVDDAILAFLDNTDQFETGLKYEKVDSLSDPGMYLEVTARIIDMNTRTVTYQVQTSSFTGGAHPNSAIQPFSYDLKNGRVLTAADLFVEGSEPKLLKAIKESLAYEMNTSVDKLDDAGIFTSQLTYIGAPYINGDAIVFHYNPYEIAPYAAGMIDVNVWAPEIEDCLTPEAKSLLN